MKQKFFSFYVLDVSLIFRTTYIGLCLVSMYVLDKYCPNKPININCTPKENNIKHEIINRPDT